MARELLHAYLTRNTRGRKTRAIQTLPDKTCADRADDALQDMRLL